MSAEEKLLGRLGIEAEFPDTGCCGMAGSFGFKQQHAAMSVRIGELALLPAVRAATPETLILSDGFSCRQQIEQTTDRRGLHIAQVAHLAMQQTQQAVGESAPLYPERAYLRRYRLVRRARPLGPRLLWGAAFVAAGLALLFLRRTTRRR